MGGLSFMTKFHIKNSPRSRIGTRKGKSEKERIQPPYVETMATFVYVLSDCCFLLLSLKLRLNRSK